MKTPASFLTCAVLAAALLGADPARAVLPDVLFSAESSDIVAGPPLVWPTTVPGGDLATMGSPTTITINSQLWATNYRDGSTGFRFSGPEAAAIPVNGASVVAAVRPIRYGNNDNWQSVVDIFYDRLVLVVRNGDGNVGARVNGSLDWSDHLLPNGQVTVLSLVVQPTGEFKVFANGEEVMSRSGNGPFTELNPLWNGPGPGFWQYMNVGRNDPDDWTSFNGNIGDVAVYKGALDDADRQTLETALTAKFGTATNYVITATTLTAGGTITPSGLVEVPQNSDKKFTITTGYGYVLDDVVVDSVSQGPITEYTFTDVTADHTIDVSWTGLPTISGTVTDAGTTDPIYSARVALSANPDGSSPVDSVMADASGFYEISPPDADTTWYLVASKGGHVASAPLEVVMSGASVLDQNFALAGSGTLDPIVALDATTLAAGQLLSWPNDGSGGGSFDAADSTHAPTVTTVAGKKAVQFTQPSSGGDDRETLVWAIPTPPEIAGASDWTISTLIYREDASVNSENCYMCWSGRDIGGWPASQYRTAQFSYRDNQAAVHYGADYGFDLGTPPSGEWHNVTITYDGTTEKLYLDGDYQQERVWTLDLKPNTMVMIGGAYWDGNDPANPFQNRGEDQYWRFNGAIASLQVFDQALTAEEVAAISNVIDPNDLDSDGLPDAWEIAQVGNLTDLDGTKSGPGPGAGTGDFDGDGTSDSAEWRLGLVPNDPTSFFAATIARDPVNGNVTLTWPSQIDLVFDVLWTDDLSLPRDQWFNLGPVTDTDGGPTETYIDRLVGEEPVSFYQIVLRP